ncbi:DUF1844 domain-containing protein [Lawsonia intracellularis]|uniref:DUF1844 domain-containing protein n=1 Tax=Lawsonia intracellularis (strain PHE/MN1-00) TaxID=363253 RepID=Q1MS69_LAWIP|nr:DUF1844 domain-containing protein [Lawsonia intracellularis]AGC49500.1 hypothetical protein LAW_00099 [Lawsonia intracellularis N343]KAA0205021.1 DUF1844 domain-containing protein [Lawsonia intracellularis]MBZ3892453.1 DUF1844 domain-containing protein [Lawsonia intracellularis]OMQ06162.1 hypothetical protein BW722_00570 [Lawsonia intracellularis]RBN32430.1 DUF1844 domain-containing protein [Lawsonia intracellularis]
MYKPITTKEDEVHSTTKNINGTKNTQPSFTTTSNLLPKVTFSTFILSLASSALAQLGEVPHPESGEIIQDLPMAKHTIEILSMLQEKTKECLDSDESRLIEGLLYELRMKYVMKKN